MLKLDNEDWKISLRSEKLQATCFLKKSLSAKKTQAYPTHQTMHLLEQNTNYLTTASFPVKTTGNQS